MKLICINIMRAFKDAYITNNQLLKGRLTAACTISHNFFFYDEEPLQDRATSCTHHCQVNLGSVSPPLGSDNSPVSLAGWLQRIVCTQENSNFRPHGITISHKLRALNFPLMYNQIKDTAKCIYEECSKLFPSLRSVHKP
jgi:hypothetical protein